VPPAGGNDGGNDGGCAGWVVRVRVEDRSVLKDQNLKKYQKR